MREALVCIGVGIAGMIGGGYWLAGMLGLKVMTGIGAAMVGGAAVGVISDRS